MCIRDRIFRMIFKEKRALLALYNAMNDTAYQDPEELVITTLENAIYLGMKNDVSFMICDRLFLYEHQSTKNPNMPLRNLLYVADLYSCLLYTSAISFFRRPTRKLSLHCSARSSPSSRILPS